MCKELSEIGVFPERDTMDLGTALVVLREVHGVCLQQNAKDAALAVKAVLEFVDEVLLVTETVL